ncbi:TPA: hypothetical protein SUB30_005499 [Bacillus pseudomycoides]|nr:hypothetical protein [Bacillus pseudomycoides]
MKKGYFSKVAAVALSTALLVPASAAFGETVGVNAKEKVNQEQTQRALYNDGKPFMEAYDKDDNLIKSFTQKEMQELNKQVLDPEIFKIPEIPKGEPVAHTYDENNFIISSTNKEVEKAQRAALEKVKELALTVYNYEPASFYNSVYIGGGKKFYKPQSITIDPKRKFELMTIKLYYSDGTYCGKYSLGNFIGEHNVPLAWIAKHSDSYKIQFNNNNTDGTAIHLYGGQVYY